MGMDMYIEKIWRNPQTKEVEDREELCCWQKFWGLHEELGLYGEGDYNKDVPMTKNDLERCLQYVAHNRDYFGGFSTVEDVCRALSQYDELKEAGWQVVYNANW